MDEIKIERAKKNPEQNANVISKLFFWFITPLLRLGFKKSLEPPDFYKVLSQDESQTLCDAVEKSWENEVNESKVKNRPAKLHNAIYSVFGRKYILLGLILVFEEFVKILQPVFMGRLIRYFRFCSTVSIESAYFYAFAFSMCALTLAIWHHPYFYHVQRIGMQIRVAVSGLIYKKILTVSTSGLREMEAGKIMNLLSNDVARFDQTVIFLHYFWAAPLSLIGFVAILWYEMGPSCLAGFVGLIILVPIQGFMGRKMGQYRRQVATLSDKRIGIMNELLNGIRVIKMYAWEIPFSQLVDAIRMQEIKILKLQAILQGLLVGLFFVTGKMIVLCALAAFLFSGNAISAEVVFVASALFNTVRVTLTLFLPFAFQFYAEYKVTTSRIEKFLLLKDREETIAKKSNSISNGTEKHDPKNDQDRSTNAENVGVQMMNYTARWNNEKTNALDNVNLTIEPGQLVLIVGPVGAGKSSILYSLCGECHTVSGTIKIDGKIVYVPQDPWIFSASVRQNIIFGRQRLEPQRYAKVVEVCQMEKDLESLPRGDSTVVGDRGAALSGGQKARINLARALYYDADIYLLDDPLSAVDAAVGRLLFERCINGYLRDKIRILVTHQLQYLKYADYVVVMKDGKVAASGKYQDLEKLGEKFTSILRETEESYQKSAEKFARLSSNRELNRTISQESARSPDRTQIKKILHRSTNEDANSTAETVISARDDSVFSSPKLNQPIEKDALLQEQDNLDWKREVQAQFEDEKSSGVVNWRVYFAYFRHMGSRACVVLAFAFCVFVQIVFNFSDWWLNIWVNSEDAKKTQVFNQTSGSELSPDGINASLDAICSLSPTQIEKNRLPDVFKTLGTYDYLYIYTIIIIGLTIGSLLRSVAFRIMLNRSSFVLHSKMFSAILKAPLLFFDRNPIGRILNRFSKDTGTMDELLSFATFDFIQGIITFIGVILMVGFINPLIFLVTAPLIGLFLYARCYYMRTARVVKRLEATNQSAGSIGLTLFYAVSLLGFFQWIVRQSTEMESMVGVFTAFIFLVVGFGPGHAIYLFSRNYDITLD